MGRLKIKIAGKATNMKRNAPNNNGGSAVTPSLMITKLTPQITTTQRASKMSLRLMLFSRLTCQIKHLLYMCIILSAMVMMLNNKKRYKNVEFYG